MALLPLPQDVAAPPHTGTTIVAVSYAGGVVIGADSRVSTGEQSCSHGFIAHLLCLQPGLPCRGKRLGRAPTYRPPVGRPAAHLCLLHAPARVLPRPSVHPLYPPIPPPGTYVSNRASDKITDLSDNVYLLRSGSAADTQAVADYGALLLGFWALLGGAAGWCLLRLVCGMCAGRQRSTLPPALALASPSSSCPDLLLHSPARPKLCLPRFPRPPQPPSLPPLPPLPQSATSLSSMRCSCSARPACGPWPTWSKRCGGGSGGRAVEGGQGAGRSAASRA